MNTPLITLIRQALADRLRQSEELTYFVGGEKADPADPLFTGGRIYLNRFEAWDERELTTIGVYVLGEEPIETDISPPPDERRLTVSVEILTREDEAMEERLDIIAALVEFYYTLDPLGELIRAAGGPDTLLKIEWQGNERGFVPEAELGLGINAMTFGLEYSLPWADAELPPFEEALTKWKARTAEGELEAENIVEMRTAP